MKTTLIALLSLTLFSSSSDAQWHKLRDFIDESSGISENITCVYFMDIPGPPRIGFAGTESELWRTSDGGVSWRDVWPQPLASGAFVTDMFFKDSLTGWFSYEGIGGEVYETEDGGKTWSKLNYPYDAIECIHYCKTTNRLLVGSFDNSYVSSDLGNTWQPLLDGGILYFSFSSDSAGIASVSLGNGTSGNYYHTSDGGNSWVPADSLLNFGGNAPLAIPGTPICFAASGGRIKVIRSDDYGKTWRQLIDFGPNMDSQFNEIGPYGSGYIRGDLSRLYIGSDSGMYVSTDEGVSWKNDGGPPDVWGGFSHEFYAGKGITLEGEWIANGGRESGGLWEEDWPQSGVAEREPIPTQSGPLEVFDLLGRCVYRGPADKLPILSPGAYIERTGETVQKVFVP